MRNKMGKWLPVVLVAALAGCGEPVVDISTEERFESSTAEMYDLLPEGDRQAFIEGLAVLEEAVPQGAVYRSEDWLQRRRAEFRGLTAADLVRAGREAEATRRAEEAGKPYRFVGEESELVASVVGSDYLPITGTFVDRDLGIYVVVAADGGAALEVRIDGARRDARVQAPLEPEYTAALTELFAKGERWADIARSEGAEVDKALGCFGVDRGIKELCDDSGLPMVEGLLGVRFWSHALGEQVRYSLAGVGPDGDSYEVMLTASQWSELNDQLAGIDSAVAAARERLKNRELFD